MKLEDTLPMKNLPRRVPWEFHTYFYHEDNERLKSQQDQNINKRGSMEGIEKKSHLDAISTASIYVPIFIDLYSIWDACIDICEHASI